VQAKAVRVLARRRARPCPEVSPVERALLIGAPLVVFLVGWEAIARAQVVSTLFFAGPLDVVRTFSELAADGELWYHLRASVSELVLGVAGAVVVGVPLGLALGGVRPLEGVLAPYIAAAYAAPRVAFFPLIALWFGTGLTSKALLVFFTVLFPILINSRAARSFGASRLQLFTKIVLPHSLPFIVAGLRIGSGIGLLAVYVAETYGGGAGLGYLIVSAGFAYQAAKVFVGVLGLALLGIVLNQSLGYVERRLAPWRASLR
jgi:ABC-type nitrate/sulfonate/bicarbonate transport system permease component